jgi:ABC-type branched-subunit amino acid transport system permease subunit
LLQDLQAIRDIIYGALIIVVILALPGGVYGEWLKRRARHRQATTDSGKLADQRT